jgi:hypothetical protein
MPLKKILLKSGVNRENTRYTTEGGWYDCDKIRFRQGTPEKIGGWVRISAKTFLGVCRSLWSWVTLSNQRLTGVGTNLKFYNEVGGAYYDITPLRDTNTLTAPFQTYSGSPIVTVTDAAGGFIDGDFVTFSGATSVGGLDLNGEYELTLVTASTYTITASSNAGSNAVGGGTVQAMYQINVGPSTVVPLSGWGAATWGAGAWGVGTTSSDSLRLWSQSNFGEDLVFGPRGGGLYYWDATLGVSSPTFTVTIASPGVVTTSVSLANGTPIVVNTSGALPTGLSAGVVYYVVGSTGTSFNLSATYGGAAINTSGTQSGTHRISSRALSFSDQGTASSVPTQQNYLLVSDINRFVFAFGTTEYGTTVFDPMLIRWSDQENAFEWAPAETNQAGFQRLSRGSRIITANQSRQEVLVWTDAALYSMQYVGAPEVWSVQLVGENISIVGQNAVAYSNGVSYWMGRDKFYKYDGRTQTLNCDLRQYVFGDINTAQYDQVFAGTNEGFNEIWWFYCSEGATTVDKYVIYNYAENVWYYGTMARTAWLDSGLRQSPLAATYSNNLVNHEEGVDNSEGSSAQPITAYITSSEFDLDDGHTFAFIWRVLPDITFRGSTAGSPAVTMYMLPLQNSGAGYTSPASVGGSNSAGVTRVAVLPIEAYTGQVFTRVRGRQLSIKVESTELGVMWQLGAPRLDLRSDGRR